MKRYHIARPLWDKGLHRICGSEEMLESCLTVGLYLSLMADPPAPQVGDTYKFEEQYVCPDCENHPDFPLIVLGDV